MASLESKYVTPMKSPEAVQESGSMTLHSFEILNSSYLIRRNICEMLRPVFFLLLLFSFFKMWKT